MTRAEQIREELTALGKLPSSTPRQKAVHAAVLAVLALIEEAPHVDSNLAETRIMKEMKL